MDNHECKIHELATSSQAKGTKSTSFLTHVRKEQCGLSTIGLRRWNWPMFEVYWKNKEKCSHCPMFKFSRLEYEILVLFN